MNAAQDLSGIPSLSSRERRLIALSLGQRMTAGDMEILTYGLDIDRCSQVELLILSCIGYKQGWERFPPKIVSRLKGLHQYWQVHNTIRIPWLLEEIHTLREAGIPVMLLKGLAFRFYYAEGIPRIMGDYDIAVPEERYGEAIRALQSGGETYLGNAPWLYHGQIQGKDRPLEIHSWIFKHHGEKGTDIWDCALPCAFFGEDVLVPCPEDMLLHQLDNFARDLFEGIFPSRMPQFLCDCFRIAERISGFDPHMLAVRAAKLHVTNSARRLLPLLADCFSDKFSHEEIDSAFPWTPEYQRWLEAGLNLQRATERWKSYHYKPGGAMTPRRLVRALARHHALSRMRTVEMKAMGQKYSFGTYCMDLCRSGAVQTLLRRFRRPWKDPGEAENERKSK